MKIFRGVRRTPYGTFKVSLKGLHIGTFATELDAIKARIAAEEEVELKIITGELRVFRCGRWAIRSILATKEGLWFNAQDICEAAGYHPTYIFHLIDKIPTHLIGLAHGNHGARSYRVVNLEGALVILSILPANTEDLKRWLLMHVYPITVMDPLERMRMIHHLMGGTINILEREN